jgi:[histone H3]-lysine36 N-trimethyltransferase
VEDPAAELSERQAQKIKKHVKEFLDKAVVKFNGHQERKNAASERRSGAEGDSSSKAPVENGTPHSAGDPSPSSKDDTKLADDDILSDADIDATPASSERKRKRVEDGAVDSPGLSSLGSRDLKRIKGADGDEESPISPPPPPPPPAANDGASYEEAEKEALREQEEALMRENEEAQRLEDEANRTQAMETAAGEMQKEISAAQNAAEVMSH